MSHPTMQVFILSLLVAVAPADPVDYERDIKPVLRRRCFSCHGGLKQESGLRLDTAAAIRRGGDSGPAITEDGQPSLLLERISETNVVSRMPPEGDPLSPEEIALFRNWIAQGALSPSEEQPEEDVGRHWAFQTPKRPQLPRTKERADFVNPVDMFLSAAQERASVVPSMPAPRHVLLRRLYLDLIGLPPTPDELAEFSADGSPLAVERVVDRLLSRPEYGERWGRNWMDIWRYSDWYGRRGVPDALNSYGQIWRWRDWIVRSLNADKPYDRMVHEMLAADEIAPTDDENVVATGFVVRNYYRWNYNTWMKDLVEHTGKAFLGITLNCCHCHDHKYDPFTNQEYFAFRAVFEPIDIRQERVAGEPDPGPYPEYKLGVSLAPLKSGMVRIHDANLDAETYVYTKGESRDRVPDLPPVAPGIPRFLHNDDFRIEPVDLPPAAWYPGLKQFIREEERNKSDTQIKEATGLLARSRELDLMANDDASRQAAHEQLHAAELGLAKAEAARAALDSRIDADRIRFQNAAGDPEASARAAVRAERQADLAKAQFDVAEAERALGVATRQSDGAKESDGGKEAREKIAKAKKDLAAAQDVCAKAEKNLESDSTEYTALSPKYPRRSTGRRRALATWITSRQNPLAARVAVNHIWHWHFGRPLVGTTANLGRNGDSPTHPKLLDWLACELMDGDWQMKRIHRLLVTSQAYRRSSSARLNNGRGDAEFLPSVELDPENRLLWRFNARRLEAEVVRDSLLHTAGTLDCTMGGKEIDESQGLTSTRRSLYFATHAEGQVPWLQLFDAASPVDCYMRSTSVRPQQALAMSNSELALKQARLLARSLHTSFSNQTEFVVAAFKQLLCRDPTPGELAASCGFLDQQVDTLAQLDRATKVEESVPPSTDPEIRARENFVHALFSHSDFVTVR